LLRLKRVEIQGFKSFFDKTEMRFNGTGIAAVVGPNGCGKSNLSDAISWVLGEQSARLLRGTRMEDVIFAGTRDRKPLGMASVTMTLVDPRLHVEMPLGGHTNGHANGHTNGHTNGHSDVPAPVIPDAVIEPAVAAAREAPPKPQEITITRRLFRSGESEYLINGKLARLRDIQDLFLGTGLGPESYAIIEQGRIGQILSNKPSDRRSVIEEAAGVGKFKTRKRLAEAKLEGAKQNLARVFDILEEVGRQVNSLKRQASKAKRYDEYKSEMLKLLRSALSGRFRTLERETAKTVIELNLATSGFQSLSARVAEQEAAYTSLQQESYRLDAELTEARGRLAELRVDQERTRGRLESQAAQVSTIETRLAQGEAETQELEGRQHETEELLERQTAALAELEEQTENVRRKLAAMNAERERLQQQVQERSRQLESGRQQVLRLLGEASTLKNQITQIEEYLAANERDTVRVRQDEESAARDLERLGALKAELSERMSARQMELAATADQRRLLDQDLAERRQRLSEMRRELEQLRGEASRLKARRDSLEEVISHRSYTTEAVKRLFTAVDRGQAADLKPLGVLADFVEVEHGFEKATEEFLHEELEYVVVGDWSEATRGVEVMRAGQDGRATFLIHPPEWPIARERQTELAVEPGITGRLADRLRLTNGLTHAPAELIPRLANCWLAEDREVAQRLAPAWPDAYFLLPDGVSYHGYAVTGGKKTGAGPLALKRELRELTDLVQHKLAALAETQTAADELDKEVAALGEQVERLRSAQQQQEKEALALDHEFRKMGEELSRAQSKVSVARLELQRLEKDRARSLEQRGRDTALLAEKETARGEQERALEESRQALEALQTQMAAAAEEHSALRADLAGFEERRRAERAAQSRLESQVRELAARRDEIAAELESLGEERARLLSDNIELDARSARLTEEITALEQRAETLSAGETELRARLAALDEELKGLRLEVQATSEKRSQIEIDLVRKQAELKYMDETSRKELGLPVAELAAGEETVLEDEALTEAEQKAADLRARIEALGPVNTEALEQYQEAQQRYEFLNAQRQDLLDSIRDTEKALHEIDVESRKRFTEAFAAINEHFREMFVTLFGGGVGEMRLTDEENVAESGIDIVASPPGKKLQNVLLLSGGEKSLTAMALLMAIFRYQPSPFCILDEVDAPLDEANIERLTRLLKEMSVQTQFVVITHAKRTMEAAQALFGVTMQEPGISRLVSVKFQPANGAPVPPAKPPAQTELRM
jgi:chromosome segregation protein